MATVPNPLPFPWGFGPRALPATHQVEGIMDRRDDEWGRLHQSGLHSTGRIILNLWRILRGELRLGVYTFENCVAAALRTRVPHVPHTQMAAWYSGGPHGARCAAHLPPD